MQDKAGVAAAVKHFVLNDQAGSPSLTKLSVPPSRRRRLQSWECLPASSIYESRAVSTLALVETQPHAWAALARTLGQDILFG